MQVLEVIRTLRWIQSLFAEETLDLLFNWEPARSQDGKREVSALSILSATQDLASVSRAIRQNPHAVELLKAFNLEVLLDNTFIAKFGLEAVMAAEDNLIRKKLREIRPAWLTMIGCIHALDKLGTPRELRDEKLKAAIISLELRHRGRRKPNLPDLSRATGLLQELYAATARIYRMKSEGRLTILKVDSGETIRIDCKGVPDVVKHLRSFVTEAWYRIRHEKAEEVFANNRVMLSSLAAMREISAQESTGTFSPEESELLRRRAVNSVLGLFESGGLLVDIPAEERIDNIGLLESFMPKLLPAPEKKARAKRKKKKRRTSRKRASKARTRKKEPATETVPAITTSPESVSPPGPDGERLSPFE